MRNKATLVSILVLCIVLAFLIMSCAPGPANVNTNSNATANQNVNNVGEAAEVAPAVSQDPCQDNDPGTKKDKLKKAVEDKIKGDVTGNDSLSYQYNRNFYIEFREGTGGDAGYAVAVVTGAIQGQKKLKKLVDFIEDFVDTNCKVKVEFKAAVVTKAYPPTGFEWCESPMQACPGGYCAETCPMMSNTNTNSGANTNLNTNSRVNANGNVNRVP